MNNPENNQGQTSEPQMRVHPESVQEIGRSVGEEVSKQLIPKRSDVITEEQKNNLSNFFKMMRGKFTNFKDEDKFFDKLYESTSQEHQANIEAEIQSQLTLDESHNINVREAMALCARFGLSQEASREQLIEHLRQYMNIKPNELNLLSKESIQGLLDGDGKLMDRGKVELKRTALKLINRLFAPVDADPERMFQESFNEYHEGVAYRYLKRIMINLEEDVRKDKSIDNSVADFIQKGMLQEISRERELRELSHNIDIWMRIITEPKQLIEHVARYNVSSLTAPLTSETGGKIIAEAISELERFLQFDMGLHKNQVRPSLFSSGQNTKAFFLESVDREKLKNRLIRRIAILQEQSKETTTQEHINTADIQAHDTESLQDFNGEERWEIERALKYANMISFLTSMRAFEIMAAGAPNEEFKGSLFYDMLKFFNPSWHWRILRGSPHNTMHMPELYEIKIDTAPQMSFWRRIVTPSQWKYWDPEKVKKQADKNFQPEKYQTLDKMEKDWLLQDSEYKKLLNIFGLGGLASRWGWRGAGFTSTYEEILRFDITLRDYFNKNIGFKMSDNWTKAYEILSERVGAGTRFFFDAERAKKFAEVELRNHLKKNEGEWKALSKPQKGKIVHDYQNGKKYREIVYTDDGKDYTYSELLEARTLVLRGSNFDALLQRSPIDFLNNVNQMSPEVLPKEFGGITLKIEGEDKDIIDYISLDIDSDTFKNLHQDEKNKLQQHQERLISRFGERNIICLQKVNQFYRDAFELGVKELHIEKIDGEIMPKDKGKIIEWFYNELADASEKVKLRNGVHMESEDVNHQGLAYLLFSEEGENQGVIPYFQAYIGSGESTKEEREKSEFGNDDKSLGNAKDGFFYRMARTWYTDMGHNMHPNTADIDWRYVFKEMGSEAGENTIRRLWSDLHGWNEITKKLANLDHMLMDAAKSHKMDEIYKLHHEIHTLEGMGLDAKRANYYIATIVARYFRENSAARIPFFIGKAYELINATTVSLSRLHGGRLAQTMDVDDINAYFRRLAYDHAIGFEGPWSFEQLSRAERADTAKIWVTDFIPNTTVLLGLFSIIKWIQHALKEHEDKK